MGKRLIQIGCGAIGSNTVRYISPAVELVALADRDVVSEENIGIADFKPAHIGKPKTAVLANRIRDVYPDKQVIELHGDIPRTLSPAWLDRFDLVSAAVDNDRAAFSVCRMVAQSEKRPPVVFANGEPRSGAAQVRIINFNADPACIGCHRSKARWEAPVANPYGCRRDAARASAEAAFLAAALAVNTSSDLLRDDRRAAERAGENLIVNSTSGVAYKSRLTLNPECPAFYHYFHRTPDTTICLSRAIHQTSLADLLEAVAESLGEEAFLELGERQYAGRFLCSQCSEEHLMLRLVGAESLCPCGGTLKPLGEVHRIRASLRHNPLANVTLAEFGCPAGDVFLALAEDHYLFFATELDSLSWSSPRAARNSGLGGPQP